MLPIGYRVDPKKRKVHCEPDPFVPRADPHLHFYSTERRWMLSPCVVTTHQPHPGMPDEVVVDCQAHVPHGVVRGRAGARGHAPPDYHAASPVLGWDWGEGNCCNATPREDEPTPKEVADKSLACKRVLLWLDALYDGTDDEEGADYALRLDRVTGAEMFFLASCTSPSPTTSVGRAGRWPPAGTREPPWLIIPACPRAAGTSTLSFGLSTVVLQHPRARFRGHPRASRSCAPSSPPRRMTTRVGKDFSRGIPMPRAHANARHTPTSLHLALMDMRTAISPRENWASRCMVG